MKPESTVRSLGVLVGRDFRQLFRDRAAIILLFIAPIAAAVVSSVSLGAPQKVSVSLAVVGSFDPQVTGPTAPLLKLIASDFPGPPITSARSVADARKLVRDGKVAAALIVPDKNHPDDPVRLIENKYVKLSGSGAAIAAETFVARINAVRFLNQHHAAQDDASVQPVQLETVSPGGRVLDGAELYGPAIAAFFLLLTAGSIARGIQVERERGTLARLHVMPLDGSTIILGKFITMLLVTGLEFTLVLTTMSLAFGARWGNPLSLAAIVIALTVAIGALALLIASFGGSVRRVHYFEIMLALLLGALGGNLVPLQNLPNFAQRIALLTPNGLAIRAMRNVATSSQGFVEVTAPVAGLLTFAAVAGLLAWFNRRRLIEP